MQYCPYKLQMLKEDFAIDMEGLFLSPTTEECK